MLKKVAKALEGLKQLSEFVPKKSLLKNGLQSMIEHLEAADSVGRTCNFKFGSAETEITEDVPLPRDDTIVTGHSRKRSLSTEKGCHHHHHGNCTITNEYQITNRSRLNFNALYFNQTCSKSCTSQIYKTSGFTVRVWESV